MYEDLTVILCCAGMGKRLGIDFPKALLDLNGKPLILNLLDALKDVEDVRIVVGFKYKDLIETIIKYRKNVTFCFNRDYASNGPAESLMRAFVGARNRVMVIDGDVVLDPQVLKSGLNLNNTIFANTSNKEDGIRIAVSNNKVMYFTKKNASLTYAGIAIADKDAFSFDGNHKYIYETLNLNKSFDVKIVDSIDVNSSIDYSYALKLVNNHYSQNLVIGCLGGMGTYATINFFKLYAETFPAKCENERPRLIIDNNCTMPSRVRAYLYNENVESLISQMSSSLLNLINSGANRLILACNTSHLFLDKIYENHPELRDYIVNIVEICCKKIKEDTIKSVRVLGSEATLDSGVFTGTLAKYKISSDSPSEDEFNVIRDCIEAVKQNNYTQDIKNKFLSLVNVDKPCILGCTELPILYDKYKDEITNDKIYDPLELSLIYIKNNFF